MTPRLWSLGLAWATEAPPPVPLQAEILCDDASKDVSSLSTDAVISAVREWAAEIRKTVADDADSIPPDPPTESQAPRAAALISDEEAMSARGGATLEDVRCHTLHLDDQDLILKQSALLASLKR